MLQTSHVDKRFTGSQAVLDIVIGMSDGLTVPPCARGRTQTYGGFHSGLRHAS